MKTYKVKVRSRGQHGCHGKEVFYQTQVQGKSSKEAIEKLKKEMLQSTYYDFYSQFKMYENEGLNYKLYSIQNVFPFNEKGYPPFMNEMDALLHQKISERVFERLEIVAQVVKQEA